MDAAELLSRTAREERRLARLVEENNALECNYVQRRVHRANEERPAMLRDMLADAERSALAGSPLTNRALLEREVRAYEAGAAAVRSENMMLESEVEQKRFELLRALRQLRARAPRVAVRPPDSNCSSDVEGLARRIAQEIEGVDEEELVRYLARGREDAVRAPVRDRARELGLARYNIAVAKRTRELMLELIERIEKEGAERDDGVDEQHEELVQAFQEARDALDGIADEEEDGVDGVPVDEEKWGNLEKLEEEMGALRTKLLNTLNDKSIIQIPAELSNNEREKEALVNCLDALRESNAKMFAHLQDLAEKRIVDRQIYTEDEVRDIVREYNELKLNE